MDDATAKEISKRQHTAFTAESGSQSRSLAVSTIILFGTLGWDAGLTNTCIKKRSNKSNSSTKRR